MKRKQTHLKFRMNEVKESHKNNTSVCTMAMFVQSDKLTFSCPCAHHDSIWERVGTAAHIINPVLLHTVRSHNILATI